MEDASMDYGAVNAGEDAAAQESVVEASHGATLEDVSMDYGAANADIGAVAQLEAAEDVRTEIDGTGSNEAADADWAQQSVQVVRRNDSMDFGSIVTEDVEAAAEKASGGGRRFRGRTRGGQQRAMIRQRAERAQTTTRTVEGP